MKKLFYLVIFLFGTLTVFAQTRTKQKVKPDYIQYIKGTYVQDDKGTVGDVYSFIINTRLSNITIDSVWFGATPVPCDVFETKRLQRIQGALPKGSYKVQVNKNLYEKFHQRIDSTNAFKNFKAPFTFKGDAIIMYSYKQKRYYKIVQNVSKVAAKGKRI